MSAALALCPKCHTDHEGYPTGSLGAETRCLRAQAAAIGADHLVDQVDAFARNNAERRDEALTFELGDMDYPHRVGDPTCDQGWCGGGGFNYPRPHEECEADPPGLMHANFADESYDGDYWLFTACDRCGESE